MFDPLPKSAKQSRVWLGMKIKADIKLRAVNKAASLDRSLSNYIEHLIAEDTADLTPKETVKVKTNGSSLTYTPSVSVGFKGKQIEIDADTFDAWEKKFTKLPDLTAALAAADEAWAEGPPENWRERLLAWLEEQNEFGDAA
jgi:hypothetical protein